MGIRNYVFTGAFSGVLLIGTEGWAIRSGDPVAWLAGVAGMASGAVIAILASPKKQEMQKFPEYAKLGYGFLTGYVVSKADRLFDYLMGNSSSAHPAPILDLTVQIRLLVGVSCFLLGLILIFAVRSRSIQALPTRQDEGTGVTKAFLK